MRVAIAAVVLAPAWMVNRHLPTRSSALLTAAFCVGGECFRRLRKPWSMRNAKSCWTLTSLNQHHRIAKMPMAWLWPQRRTLQENGSTNDLCQHGATEQPNYQGQLPYAHHRRDMVAAAW